MRRTLTRAAVATALLATPLACSAQHKPVVHPMDASVLREYAGVYQWGPNAFLYLQLWSELAGSNQITAFDESGEVRTLFPTDRDRFFAGPGAGVPTAIESRIDFQRDGNGKI